MVIGEVCDVFNWRASDFNLNRAILQWSSASECDFAENRSAPVAPSRKLPLPSSHYHYELLLITKDMAISEEEIAIQKSEALTILEENMRTYDNYSRREEGDDLGDDGGVTRDGPDDAVVGLGEAVVGPLGKGVGGVVEGTGDIAGDGEVSDGAGGEKMKVNGGETKQLKKGTGN
ncbi:hypothetical protein Fmac_001743 [Flemingia macrophylla]|uniref:Uncharacterized protein n=1 Tax=Flemingia macrophylla TaxID=520843 RepID=A0ABD1NHY6_9FABA